MVQREVGSKNEKHIYKILSKIKARTNTKTYAEMEICY